MAKFNISKLSLLFSRTDEETMWRVKMEDDHRAFAQLVDRWEGPIRQLCTRMTADPHKGEDLKQETFARLFAKRESYEPTGRFSTYLWRIALNICHDEIRRVNRRQEFFPDQSENEAASGMEDLPSEEPWPDGTAVLLEEGDLVRQALQRLPEIYRTVVVLRHYEGMKLAKISEVLQVPIGTVNSRMAEALAKLTRMLEPKLGKKPKPAAPSERSKEILVI